MRRLLAATFSLAAAAAAMPARGETPSATTQAVAPVAAEPPSPKTPPAPLANTPAPDPPFPTPAANTTAATAKSPAKTARAKKRKKPAPPPPPAAELLAINTHETYLLRPDAHGRFTRAGLRGWNRFLRCHHTGRVHAMSTRLAELIYEVDKHFDFKKVEVVAGYRAPRVAREKGNPKSPHKKGVACDFRIEGVPNTELRDFERTLPRVGVGYYPNSEFVHLDCDPSRNKHSAFWIDYSRPGERARYSKNPNADLEQEEGERNADSSEPRPGEPLYEALQPINGGEEPQAPLLKGAPTPNAPPPIFALPENN